MVKSAKDELKTKGKDLKAKGKIKEGLKDKVKLKDSLKAKAKEKTKAKAKKGK